jgi:hypothetical protein
LRRALIDAGRLKPAEPESAPTPAGQE